MERIIALIGPELERLEAFLLDSILTDVDFIKKVASYVIKSGGKRIRPILLILSSRLSGDSSDRYLLYAASIEFIHTATLLHDDVVDNAKVRRGKIAANVLFGNESSVLIGDYLYSRAFDLMVKEGDTEILKILAKTTNLLSEGEILELVKTSDIEIKEEEYFKIIERKTAALFSAACEIGGLLGNLDKKRIEALRDFGYYFGLIFQITDDILDYTSCESVFGKKIGTDLKEGKVTLPLIKALRDTSQKERLYIKRVLEKKNQKKEDFQKVKNLIEKYGGISYAFSKIHEFSRKAKERLLLFPPSEYRVALSELIDFLLVRKV